MTDFQKEVKDTLGVSRPGVLVVDTSTYRSSSFFITDDDKCSVGSIVRKGATAGSCVGAAGTNKILGIIICDQYYTGQDLGQTLPKGTTVNVLQLGIIAVANPMSVACTQGQDMWVDNTTGKAIFSSEDVADATKTNFTVYQSAPSEGIAFVIGK